MPTDKPKGTKPAHEIASIDGLIKVAIWRNEGERGPLFSVTCRRRYKDKTTEEWKDSYSYSEDSILALAKLLDLAHTWIAEQHQQQRAGKKAAA